MFVEEHTWKLCWKADIRLVMIRGTASVFSVGMGSGALTIGYFLGPPTLLESASVTGKPRSVLKKLQTISVPALDAILKDTIELAEAVRSDLSEKDGADRQ